MKGLVFDIKRFALHDGAGIRSTLFSKGCHLNCIWCHNPEGISLERKIWYFRNKCIRCGSCLNVCPTNALTEKEGYCFEIEIEYKKCVSCGLCVKECPAEALVFESKEMSVDEAVMELLKDKKFYEDSGGGITISGGDPMVQYRFNIAVLQKCKMQGIHTSIETALLASDKIVKQFIEVTDLFIVDLKEFDDEKHNEFTGQGNKQIKTNFEMLAGKGVDILVRIPMIPGYTATSQNVQAIALYVKDNRDDIPIELMNFNNLAESKYQAMNIVYNLPAETQPLTESEIKIFYRLIKDILKNTKDFF